MSVAFTKEDSAQTASETMLPDRPIPEGPNLVTSEGLRRLEEQLAAARRLYDAAMAHEDVNERRRQAANPFRDMRYLLERVRTAQIVPVPDRSDVAAFGLTVTLEREDGRIQRWRIVGEDEADPKAGTVSFASPLARAVMGRAVGEVVSVGGGDVEITAIA